LGGGKIFECLVLNGGNTVDGGEGGITGITMDSSSGGSSIDTSSVNCGGSSITSSMDSGGSSIDTSSVNSGGGSIDSGSMDSRGSNSVDSRGSMDSMVGLSVSGVVDNRLLNNLMDGVDLVRGGDRDGTGNSDFIGSSNVLLDNDLSGNCDGDLDGDINVILVYLELRDNVGLDRGDLGVSSHRGKDPLLGDGISGSRSKVDRCGGDGSISKGSSGDSWRGEGLSLNNSLGLTGNIRVGRLGDNFLVGLDILVASLDLLGSNLDGLVANNSVFKMFLDNGRSSGIGVVGLADGYGSRDSMSNSVSSNSMSSNSMSSNSMSSYWKTKGVSSSPAELGISLRCRGTIYKGGKGKCEHKTIHFSTVC